MDAKPQILTTCVRIVLVLVGAFFLTVFCFQTKTSIWVDPVTGSTRKTSSICGISTGDFITYVSPLDARIYGAQPRRKGDWRLLSEITHSLLYESRGCGKAPTSLHLRGMVADTESGAFTRLGSDLDAAVARHADRKELQTITDAAMERWMSGESP